MSSGCGDVLSLEDLRIAKLHHTFEAEVITGKAGGVAGGADIDFATNQVTGQVQKTLPAVLRDSGFTPTSWDFSTGGVLSASDRDKVVFDPVSKTWYSYTGTLPVTVPAGFNPVGNTNWKPQTDPDLRAQLASNSGSSIVGTGHRVTLAADLNAIDRRPDGYSGGVYGVLATGRDVDIDKDISTNVNTYLPAMQSRMVYKLESGQTVTGKGGKVTDTSGKSAVFGLLGADATAPSENVTITDINAGGTSSPTDNTNEAISSFALLTRFTKNMIVRGVRSFAGLAGGVYLSQSRNAIVSDVITEKQVYHTGEDVGGGRAGYSVLTDNAKETIINNVMQTVEAAPNGRHLLYMSTGSGGDTNGNVNVIANNMIGRWIGRDDRNQWMLAIRASQRFILNNAIQEGGNGGMIFNDENNNITDYIASNMVFQTIKYAAGVPVYAVGQGQSPTYKSNRWLITNQNIYAVPKDSTVGRTDIIAFNISGNNGMLSNAVTTCPGESTPILVGHDTQSVQNVTISNIHDNIAGGSSGTPAPLIAFTGSAVSNITVRGITTSRSPMFLRLGVVTDLTVDFTRKARITFNSGVVSKIDIEGITGTVTPSATGFTVAFPSHVTQKAVDNAAIRMMSAGQVNVLTVGAKSLTFNTFTNAGAVLSMLTGNYSFELTLFS